MQNSDIGPAPDNSVLGLMYREIIALLEGFEARGLATRPYIAFMAETATLTLLTEARRTEQERLQALTYMREREERVGRMSEIAEKVRGELIATLPNTNVH